MLFRFFQFLLIFLYCLNNTSATTNSTKQDKFNPMKQTPDSIVYDNISMPNEFNKSNNMIRNVGSFNVAIGEPLHVRGKITDAFGVPIAGAIVRVWQTNAAGKYHSLETSNSRYIDKNFLSSGTAVTNNLGQYEFITIFPGFYDDRAPHIKFIVVHKKFPTVRTEMFFKDHDLNKSDLYYIAYNEKDQKRVTANVRYKNPESKQEGKIAEFNIVLDGIHKYKSF